MTEAESTQQNAKKKKERELRFHCFLYSQANLVSKLLKQMAKAWKAESG